MDPHNAGYSKTHAGMGQRLMPGWDVHQDARYGNVVGYLVEGMYPWTSTYFIQDDPLLSDCQVISNKWNAYLYPDDNYPSQIVIGDAIYSIEPPPVQQVVIDYTVFSYWNNPRRDSAMDTIRASMPFHQKYGPAKSIDVGNAELAYITPKSVRATGNVYHIEFCKGYVYATVNLQISEDPKGEALSLRIAEELEKKIPAAGSDTSRPPPGTQVQTAPDILSAAFSATPLSGESPLTVHFTDKSTGHPVKWKWDFGDGYTSTSQNPVHTYTALEDILGTPDHFTVALTVWDAQSSDVATKVNYITVYPAISAGGTARPVNPSVPAEPPRASFSASPATGTAPLRVYFSDTSTATISSWLWDFGDGYRSEVSSPSHTFKEPGTYTVRLTVSGAGLSDTARKTITVHAVTGGTAGVTEGPTSPVGGSDTSRPPPGTGDGGSLSPEEIGGGVAAAVAGAVGGLVALGSGALSGILPGMRPPPGISPDDLRNLQEEYQNLMDTLATERANRDA